LVHSAIIDCVVGCGAITPNRHRLCHHSAVTGQPFSLEGRCAIVTGSAAGIGLATATMLAELGADVVLNSRDPARLTAAVDRVARTARGSVRGVPGDASSDSTIAGLIEAAGQCGGASIDVANAGGGVVTDEVTEQTIRLRQQFKTRTPDAVIAATALVNGLTVVTHNTGDFIRLGVKTLAITMKP
jgi:NAD(P)-dependent dehydrogenase (short-subunit alcohol dehydrogenase family)